MSEKEMEWFCPSCGAKVDADATECNGVYPDGYKCKAKFAPVKEKKKSKRKLKDE